MLGRDSNRKKKVSKSFDLETFLCGLDETRTRDPLRDRQVF